MKHYQTPLVKSIGARVFYFGKYDNGYMINNKQQEILIMKNHVLNETNIPLNKKDRTEEQQEIAVTKFNEFVAKAKEFTQQIHVNRVNLLKLVLEAKQFGLNRDEMASLLKALGYSRATKSKITGVIDSEVLMSRLDKLPSSYATLYHLKNKEVSEQDIDTYIADGRITTITSFYDVNELLKTEGYITDESESSVESGNCTIKVEYDKLNAKEDAIKIFNAIETTLNGYVKQLNELGYTVENTVIKTDEVKESN